jgi:1,4-alpha-glucan branching enzyme
MARQPIAAEALKALLKADHGAPFTLLGPNPVYELPESPKTPTQNQGIFSASRPNATAKTETQSSTLTTEAVKDTVNVSSASTQAHLIPGRVVVRALRPTAQTLALIETKSGTRSEMTRMPDTDLFEVELDGDPQTIQYRLEESNKQGETVTFDDPYRFGPMLTDMDLHLFGEGQHWHIYDKLGSHTRNVGDVTGTNFAVWAPNARRVSVVGPFNNWDGRVHAMQINGNSGIWELFIPGLAVGELYKYEVKSHYHGYMELKTDPYGQRFELRPNNATIVTDISGYEWQDDAWMQKRRETDPFTQPMSIYEVHLGSWQRDKADNWLTYRDLADQLVAYVNDMGYTHVELMPVAEHPFDGSWGYQVTGYYAPTSRYGSPKDFMYFVDQCHQHGIGVIVDWVPAHFPKDGYALSFFDGTHLYSHADPRKGEHPDWGTYIFNYGRNEVRNFLIANALFWLERYHIDGLRVDAVSSMVYLNFSREEGQWVPNEYGGHENLAAIRFLQQTNEIIHEQYPGAVTIAEESTSWPMVSRPTYLGGLGFTFKWNMGWMHDTLNYVAKDPIHRRYHHNMLTFSMMYHYTENFILSLSHDEVVHLKKALIAKAPGDYWQKFATLRLLFGYQYTHPGKKLNFMGAEIAQWSEWSEERALDWMLLDFDSHKRLQNWSRDLNRFYANEPALYQQDYDPSGFLWINANDADNSVFTYIRFAKDTADFVVVALNFTPVPLRNYRIGVPEAGFYAEVLNSDSTYYGGSNLGNSGGIQSIAEPAFGMDNSLQFLVPPLGMVVFKLKRDTER